jgi:hypothetical protein
LEARRKASFLGKPRQMKPETGPDTVIMHTCTSSDQVAILGV